MEDQLSRPKNLRVGDGIVCLNGSLQGADHFTYLTVVAVHGNGTVDVMSEDTGMFWLNVRTGRGFTRS